ncbi:hypothetical protein BCR42DRAFT_416507 [Absidia repens]|uniref:FHA domain-containing protein n=1 Tax=Absidia repens TaxID=90262 RepID=A0A1X2IEY5_9FUNG|nr:hypothetical protein BCR42DRAFT_416507 [Absidia repens]
MPKTVKWNQYFAAQSAYLQHNPRRGAQCHTSSPHEPSIIIHGIKSSKLTIGRGHGSGVQVGRRNPRMSRQHFVIEHKPHLGYTLTVQSPNGVLVDRIMFMAGEHIPLVKGSMIEVLGTKLIFAGETPTQEEQDQYTMVPCLTSLSSSTTTTTTKESVKDSILLADRTSLNTRMDPVLCSTKGTSTITSGSATKKEVTTTNKSTPADDSFLLLSKPKSLDFLDSLIRLLANSRKTSMTIPEIGQQLKRDRPSLMELIQTTACIGCIERTGNTADGTPKEHLYYYKPELDANDERRLALSQSRRGARKCALKDTQYYFRIPPKLPNHRTKHSMDNKRKLNGQQQQQQSSNPKKKMRSRTRTKTKSTPSHITTTATTLVASANSTSSPLSLSSDDDLSDGFLTSDDEYSDKELTALFQDV